MVYEIQKDGDYIVHEIQAVKMDAKTFEMNILNVEELVKKNELAEITNPIFFEKNNFPTPDGLLSNEIFGIVKTDRAGIFAYIDLGEYFLHPLVYKTWSRMDSKIIDIVNGTKKFKIDSKGQFVEDPENGSTGLKFLKANIDKIKLTATESRVRDRHIKFIKDNKNNLFVRKWIVIPPFYRDVNTSETFKGVGEINKYYASLIMGSRSLKETAEYGFDTSDMIKGRIQNTLVNIYDYIAKSPNIASKYGIVKRSILSKSSDYGARLVITAPNIKVERPEDLPVTLDYTAVPLHAACVTFLPFVIFHARRFFENEFMGRVDYDTINGRVELDDPLSVFSDERIKDELDRYKKGFSNRFIPIDVPVIDKKGKHNLVPMMFKGRLYKGKEEVVGDVKNQELGELINRPMTWCDLFYISAVEATRDKHILVTRFPIDTYFNIFPSKVFVSSTKETESVIINDKIYKRYPKIRAEDIGSNTSNKFVDTLQMANLHLESIGGDYDGDQVQIRGVFTEEANAECDKYMNSKSQYIALNGTNIRIQGKETIQSLYCLTKINNGDKLQDPVF